MEIVKLLLTAALDVAKVWMDSSGEERAELEARAQFALSALKDDKAVTKAAHEARVAATDAALAELESKQ